MDNNDSPDQRSFYEAVTERPCLLHGWGPGECSYILDAHHVIPKRKIKAPTSPLPTELMELACADPRNGVPLCRFHHNMVEAGKVAVEWIADVEDFAHDWGLEIYLPHPVASTGSGSEIRERWKRDDDLRERFDASFRPFDY